MKTTECRRPDCDETFDDQLRYDLHLLTDHGKPWEEIPGYPRSPGNRA